LTTLRSKSGDRGRGDALTHLEGLSWLLVGVKCEFGGWRREREGSRKVGSGRLFNQAAKGASRRRAPKAPRLPRRGRALIGCAGRAAPNGSVSHTLALLPTGALSRNYPPGVCAPPEASQHHPQTLPGPATTTTQAPSAWPWGILRIAQSPARPGQHDASPNFLSSDRVVSRVCSTQLRWRWWRSCAHHESRARPSVGDGFSVAVGLLRSQTSEHCPASDAHGRNGPISRRI